MAAVLAERRRLDYLLRVCVCSHEPEFRGSGWRGNWHGLRVIVLNLVFLLEEVLEGHLVVGRDSITWRGLVVGLERVSIKLGLVSSREIGR